MSEGYQKEQITGELYLLRSIATSIINIRQGFSKNPKSIKERDIYPIPSIDEATIEAEKDREQEKEEEANKLLKRWGKGQ